MPLTRFRSSKLGKTGKKGKKKKKKRKAPPTFIQSSNRYRFFFFKLLRVATPWVTTSATAQPHNSMGYFLLCVLLTFQQAAMVADAMGGRGKNDKVTKAVQAEIFVRRFIVSQPRHTHLTCFDALLIRVNDCTQQTLLFAPSSRPQHLLTAALQHIPY